MSFELVPSKLVYGGDALGHFQGRTVMVPGALPGERLEVEEVRSAKGVMHARTLRVITPAPERVAPPCPYYGRCGGCQYQHLRYEDQLSWKREILRETLRRIGKIVWEDEIPVHAAEPWNYRNQAQFKISRSPDGRVELGFFEAESHRLVPIDVCGILSPHLNSVLAELQTEPWLAKLRDGREIELLSDDLDATVALSLTGDLTPKDAEAFAKDCLANLPGVQVVTVRSGSKLRNFGAEAIKYRVGDFEYKVSAGSFFQASRFLIPKLVGNVTRDVSGKIALDLYAGVGLFSLPLSRAFEQVTGVEGNENAAADLAANAREHGIQNLRAYNSSTYDFLRRYATAAPDLVVVDPPRAGIGRPSLQLLGQLRPARIHYVSCHPPTLARDLAGLSNLGYGVISIEMFDFFPQTAHIECLARLTKKNPDLS